MIQAVNTEVNAYPLLCSWQYEDLASLLTTLNKPVSVALSWLL